MSKIALSFAIVMLVFALVMTVTIFNAYFGVTLASELAYQREFGDDVVMAYDQADFQGIINQLSKIWLKMNQTFAGLKKAAR